jgi:hypothetical protein
LVAGERDVVRRADDTAKSGNALKAAEGVYLAMLKAY